MKRGWNIEECQFAARAYAERSNDYTAGLQSCFYIIARKIGRSEQGVRRRFDKFGPNFGEEHVRNWSHRKLSHARLIQNQVGRDPEIPEHVLAERDRRLDLERTTVTAIFCGDPLPGYSALDRRRS